MNKNVYLFEFDIDSSGKKIEFNKEYIDKYFKYYLLIADHIYLQASSPMKIKEVYSLFLKYQECFKFNNIDEIPLVSFVLSNNINGYEEYYDQRLTKLSKAHINPKKNFEYNAYNINKAKEKAKSMDKLIINGKKSFYIKKRNTSVDKLFRDKVSKLFKNEKINKQFNINKKQQKELLKYPADTDFLFQTFELNKIIKNDFKIINSENLIKIIREQYYLSNQEAVNANSSMIDIHFQINYIEMFYKSIGIKEYINKLKSSRHIFNLRTNEYYILLREIFFKMINEESLKKLKLSFQAGGLFKFINISYDVLIPLSLAIIMYGLDLLNKVELMVNLTIFVIFQGISKDILQNIINRWVSSIPEYKEYKLYQTKKLLHESLNI